MFSKFCDFNDWQSILNRIASEIIEVQDNKPLSILDVGAGLGINTECIANIVFTHRKIRNSIDIIEPSQHAREIARRLMVSEDKGGILRNFFPNLSDINTRKYDVVIFLHSTYYINDFYNWLQKIFRNNLREGGKVLVLAIPSDSPFFLDPKLALPHTSSQIKYYLSQKGFEFTPYSLTSKFYINTHFIFSEIEIDHLYHFMTSSKSNIISREEFCERLKSKASSGVIDFQDELIVIRKAT